MPNDVVDNAQSNNSTTKNSTVVVGSPRAAGTAAYGANFTIDATINDAADLPALKTNLTPDLMIPDIIMAITARSNIWLLRFPTAYLIN